MKSACLYFGSLNGEFAKKQDWTKFSLGIFASDNLEPIQDARKKGTKVFSYTHKDDKLFEERLSADNDGLFLDYSTAPNEYINDLANRLHQINKQLILNTGWGKNKRTDYGKADILLVESFLGTNSGDDGKWPVTYSKTEEHTDLKRLEDLKTYKLIALTYGPSTDLEFANYCKNKAKDYFIYTQTPGWEKDGFRLFTDF